MSHQIVDSRDQLRNVSLTTRTLKLIVTMFVTLGALLASANRSMASGAASGHGSAEQAKLAGEIQTRYKMCLENSKVKLTKIDFAEIHGFRSSLEANFGPGIFAAGDDASPAKANFLKLLQQSIPNTLSPHLASRYEAVIAEKVLKSIVSVSIGVRSPTFKRYIEMAHASMMSQQPIDLAEFDRLHKQLASEVAVSSMNANDQALGVSVPLSLTMKNPEYLSIVIMAMNSLAELVTNIQVENARLVGDIKLMRKNMARQIAYTVGGASMVIANLSIGGALVTRGAAFAWYAGQRVLLGKVGAMASGALGFSGLDLAVEGASTMSSAYLKSVEHGTPFYCEMNRSSELAHGGMHALKEGVLYGGAGGVVAAAAVSSLKIKNKALTLASWLIYGTLGYQTSQGGYEAFKAQQYYFMWQRMVNLVGVPDSAKDVHASLIEDLKVELHNHLRAIGVHGIKSAEALVLYKIFVRGGELAEGLHHGTNTASRVMGSSADSLTSSAQSTIQMITAVVGGMGAVFAKLKSNEVHIKMSKLDEAKLFMARVETAKASKLATAGHQKNMPNTDAVLPVSDTSTFAPEDMGLEWQMGAN
jgi:hypothetical protein